MARTSKTLFLAGSALAVVLALAVIGVYALRPDPQYDPSYDTSVPRPAYAQSGPAVLFDHAHLNAHAPDAGYKPFLDLIRSDGYRVAVLREPVTTSGLADVAIFVIVCPRGTNDAGD